ACMQPARRSKPARQTDSRWPGTDRAEIPLHVPGPHRGCECAAENDRRRNYVLPATQRLVRRSATRELWRPRTTGIEDICAYLSVQRLQEFQLYRKRWSTWSAAQFLQQRQLQSTSADFPS